MKCIHTKLVLSWDTSGQLLIYIQARWQCSFNEVADPQSIHISGSTFGKTLIHNPHFWIHIWENPDPQSTFLDPHLGIVDPHFLWCFCARSLSYNTSPTDSPCWMCKQNILCSHLDSSKDSLFVWLSLPTLTLMQLSCGKFPKNPKIFDFHHHSFGSQISSSRQAETIGKIGTKRNRLQGDLAVKALWKKRLQWLPSGEEEKEKGEEDAYHHHHHHQCIFAKIYFTAQIKWITAISPSFKQIWAETPPALVALSLSSWRSGSCSSLFW